MGGVGKRLRTLRTGLALVALAVIPVSTSAQPEDAETQPPTETNTFAAQFAPFKVPPTPIEVPPGAVDLSTFEAPAEPEPRSIRNLGSGIASYYGRRFHGRRTANGERFNMRAMTAAHKTLPFGSLVKVTNPRNGRSVTVRINDRGPFIRGRVIDLSRAAAQQIGMISRGHARVDMELVAK